MKSKSLHHQVTNGSEKAKRIRDLFPPLRGGLGWGRFSKPRPPTPSPVRRGRAKSSKYSSPSPFRRGGQGVRYLDISVMPAEADIYTKIFKALRVEK